MDQRLSSVNSETFTCAELDMLQAFNNSSDTNVLPIYDAYQLVLASHMLVLSDRLS